MNIGKARAIFDDIECLTASDAEKIEAINIVLDMETHNSVTKAALLNVLRWMANRQEAATDGR